MEKTRLETFADGVFAIAATLLIIEVRAPHLAPGETLGQGLLDQWQSYAAYAVSFLTIGIIWVNHHTVMLHIGRVDRTFLFLNVGFLMSVAFIPFPTALVAEFFHDRAAAVAYGLTLTVTAIFFNALWQYAAWHRRLVAEDADQREVSGITRSYWPGALIYGSATAVAFVSPVAALLLFALIACFFVLSSSLWGRGSRGD